MEIKVYNINGSETGRTINLEDSIFAIEPNDHAIYLDVKQYLADNRQGTSKAKATFIIDIPSFTRGSKEN